MRSSAPAMSTGSTRPGSRCSGTGRTASGRPSSKATPTGYVPTARTARRNHRGMHQNQPGACRNHRGMHQNQPKTCKKHRSSRRDCPMPDQPRTIEPIRKSVIVPASAERAFELFTAGLGEWWPLATHSVGQDQATGVVFGEGVGGSIVESLADGSTAVWGTVTRWEPPRLLACTWHAGTPVAE